MRGLSVLRRARDCARRVTSCLVADCWLTSRLVVLRIALPLFKRLFSVTTLAELMWARPAVPVDDRRRARSIERIERAMTTGGRLLISRNCLDRSLALYRLLSRADAAPTLVLGARQDGPILSGHAWIEIGGEPLGETEVLQYVRIVSFDADGRVHHSTKLPIPA